MGNNSWAPQLFLSLGDIQMTQAKELEEKAQAPRHRVGLGWE